MRTIANEPNAMLIADKINDITTTDAKNTTTMAKGTSTFRNRMIATIVYEEGNLTRNSRIEALQEH